MNSIKTILRVATGTGRSKLSAKARKIARLIDVAFLVTWFGLTQATGIVRALTPAAEVETVTEIVCVIDQNRDFACYAIER